MPPLTPPRDAVTFPPEGPRTVVNYSAGTFTIDDEFISVMPSDGVGGRFSVRLSGIVSIYSNQNAMYLTTEAGFVYILRPDTAERFDRAVEDTYDAWHRTRGGWLDVLVDEATTFDLDLDLDEAERDPDPGDVDIPATIVNGVDPIATNVSSNHIEVEHARMDNPHASLEYHLLDRHRVPRHQILPGVTFDDLVEAHALLHTNFRD